MKLNEINDVSQWLKDQVRTVNKQDEWSRIFDALFAEIEDHAEARDAATRDEVQGWVDNMRKSEIKPNDIGDISDIAVEFFHWWNR